MLEEKSVNAQQASIKAIQVKSNFLKRNINLQNLQELRQKKLKRYY